MWSYLNRPFLHYSVLCVLPKTSLAFIVWYTANSTFTAAPCQQGVIVSEQPRTAAIQSGYMAKTNLTPFNPVILRSELALYPYPKCMLCRDIVTEKQTEGNRELPLEIVNRNLGACWIDMLPFPYLTTIESFLRSSKFWSLHLSLTLSTFKVKIFAGINFWGNKFLWEFVLRFWPNTKNSRK